ncbi:unnamed protein product [Rhizopus stolonifer]
MNPTSCKSCFRVINQVKLQGDGLKMKTPLQVYNMLKEKNAVDLLHVAKHDASSAAFLHFSNHVMASVFYNTHNFTGLNIDGLICTNQLPNHQNQLPNHQNQLPNLQNQPPNLQNQEAHSQKSQQGGKGTQSAKLNAHILLNFIFITFT